MSQDETTPKKLFKIVDPIKVKPKKKKEPKQEVKPVTKKKEEKLMPSDTFLKLQSQSVQDYIDECHPDLRTFILLNEAYSIKGQPGKLTILTRTSYRVEISDLNARQRRITITDKKGNKVSDEITELSRKKP